MTLKNIIKGVLWFVGFASMVVLLYLALSFYVKNVSAASEVTVFGSGNNPVLPESPETDCSWMVTEGYVYKSWNKSTDKGIVSHPWYQDFEVSCVEPENPVVPYAGMPAYLSGCKLHDYNGKAQVTRIYNPPPRPIYELYLTTFLNGVQFHEPPPCDCVNHYCFVEKNNRYICEFPLLEGVWGEGTCDNPINLNASNNDKLEITCTWNGKPQNADVNWVSTEMDIKCPSKKVSRLCNDPAGYCGIIDCADLEGTSICETRITSTVCDLYCRGHFYIKDTP